MAVRRLHNWGANVKVLLAQKAEKMTSVPGHQLDILSRMGIDIVVEPVVQPSSDAPAVIIGMIPVLAAYMALGIKHALFVGGAISGKPLFNVETADAFVDLRQFYVDGAFALEQGWVYTSIVLSAATICIIERKFRHASCWFLIGAVLSAIGFMHTYEFMPTDVVGSLTLSLPKWTWGYLVLAAIMFMAPWITLPKDDSEPPI